MVRISPAGLGGLLLGRRVDRLVRLPNALPPHITLEQAKGYISSMVHGDPNLLGVAKQSVKQMVGAWWSR